MARFNFDRQAANKLASQVLQPNLPAFMTPTEWPQLHLAVIDSHDSGRNQSTVILNDFGNPTVRNVPVLLPYSLSSVPQQSHLVQLLQIGETLAVLGRQYLPPGTVVF